MILVIKSAVGDIDNFPGIYLVNLHLKRARNDPSAKIRVGDGNFAGMN
jgi:hypothetical protein